MPSYPHLRNAPIAEALVDIRVQLPPEVDMRAIEGFEDAVRDEYPEARPVQHVGAQFAVNEGTPTVTTLPTQTLGKIFWNADRSRAVQARLDGFTVNHVRHYVDWEHMIDDAMRWWKIYVRHVHPTLVTRCAVRTINRIEQAPNVDLSDRLQTRPEVSKGLPQLLEDYFMRMVVPFEHPIKAVITQATQGPDEVRPSRYLIFDVDVFAERDIDPNSPELWQQFARLREVKNACFFESFAAGALEVYR